MNKDPNYNMYDHSPEFDDKDKAELQKLNEKYIRKQYDNLLTKYILDTDINGILINPQIKALIDLIIENNARVAYLITEA